SLLQPKDPLDIGTVLEWLSPLFFEVSMEEKLGSSATTVFRKVWRRWFGLSPLLRETRVTFTRDTDRVTKGKRRRERCPQVSAPCGSPQTREIAGEKSGQENFHGFAPCASHLSRASGPAKQNY